MDFVQQGGHFLNLVQHNPGAGGTAADQGLQPVGIPGKLEKEGGIQEIQSEGLGQHLLEPRAFSRTARAEEEEGTVGPLEKTRDDGRLCHMRYALHVVILQCIFTLSTTAESRLFSILTQHISA
jgi:hypothetical protein